MWFKLLFQILFSVLFALNAYSAAPPSIPYESEEIEVTNKSGEKSPFAIQASVTEYDGRHNLDNPHSNRRFKRKIRQTVENKWNDDKPSRFEIIIVDTDKITNDFASGVSTALKWKPGYFYQASQVENPDSLPPNVRVGYEYGLSIQSEYASSGKNVDALIYEVISQRPSKFRIIVNTVKAITDGGVMTAVLISVLSADPVPAIGVGAVMAVHSFINEIFINKFLTFINYKNFGFSKVISHDLSKIGKMFFRTFLYFSIYTAAIIGFDATPDIQSIAFSDLGRSVVALLQTTALSLPWKLGYNFALSGLNPNRKNFSPRDVAKINKIVLISVLLGLTFTAGDAVLPINQVVGSSILAGAGLTGYGLWLFTDPRFARFQRAFHEYFQQSSYEFKSVFRSLTRYTSTFLKMEKKWLKTFRALAMASATTAFAATAPVHKSVDKYSSRSMFQSQLHSTFTLHDVRSCGSYFY